MVGWWLFSLAVVGGLGWTLGWAMCSDAVACGSYHIEVDRTVAERRARREAEAQAIWEGRRRA